MPLVAAYYRPESIDEALSLLATPDRIPLAGGTLVNADRTASDIGVVDLQALSLDGIEVAADDHIRIGAMATLHDVAVDPAIPSVLAMIAKAEEPSTMRTLATVGGSIASAHRDSMFLAALLAHDAHVEFAGADGQSLAALLSGGLAPGALITAVTIDSTGNATQATTGRTPADVPIVGAVGRSTGEQVTLALTGVADAPVVVDPAAPTGGLTPPRDFRGTSEYRLELARVLAGRVLGALR